MFEKIINVINKRQRKPKGKSRMYNPEKLSTLGTQETMTKRTKQKTQHFGHHDLIMDLTNIQTAHSNAIIM